MCPNIKTLFNFEPPATDDEVHASSLQFVRKPSGFNKPSRVNEAAFNLAVQDVTAVKKQHLLLCLPVRHRIIIKTQTRRRK